MISGTSKSWEEKTELERVQGFSWNYLMELAIEKMLKEEDLVTEALPHEHIKNTPQRVVKAYIEMFRGYQVDIKKLFEASFPLEGLPEMVIVKDIPVISSCMHHLVSFHGKAHFGYIPNKILIGLSKIPRLVEAYSNRPQLQERLGNQILDAFEKYVNPQGCGIIIESSHNCMALRGVKASGAGMRTQSLRGCFLEIQSVKYEFFEGIKK